MTYSDILSMPTYERRFFLGLLTKDIVKKEEHIEEMREKAKSSTSTSKGSRTTRVSGAQLKNRINSGDVPIK